MVRTPDLYLQVTPQRLQLHLTGSPHVSVVYETLSRRISMINLGTYFYSSVFSTPYLSLLHDSHPRPLVGMNNTFSDSYLVVLSLSLQDTSVQSTFGPLLPQSLDFLF